MKRLLLLLTTILTCALSVNAHATPQQMSSETQNETATAIFAAGCFWCAEKDFEGLEGVDNVVSGYTGGENTNPTYENHPGHYEAIKVTYDPNVISYDTLLTVFWRNHDPFDAAGQFCDRGDSYRAAIFVMNDVQREKAEAAKTSYQEIFSQDIVTPVLNAQTFYDAEQYHQNYANNNPVRYKFYRWNCGRDARLEDVWGGR